MTLWLCTLLMALCTPCSVTAADVLILFFDVDDVPPDSDTAAVECIKDLDDPDNAPDSPIVADLLACVKLVGDIIPIPLMTLYKLILVWEEPTTTPDSDIAIDFVLCAMLVADTLPDSPIRMLGYIEMCMMLASLHEAAIAKVGCPVDFDAVLILLV